MAEFAKFEARPAVANAGVAATRETADASRTAATPCVLKETQGLGTRVFLSGRTFLQSFANALFEAVQHRRARVYTVKEELREVPTAGTDREFRLQILSTAFKRKQ